MLSACVVTLPKLPAQASEEEILLNKADMVLRELFQTRLHKSFDEVTK